MSSSFGLSSSSSTLITANKTSLTGFGTPTTATVTGNNSLPSSSRANKSKFGLHNSSGIGNITMAPPASALPTVASFSFSTPASTAQPTLGLGSSLPTSGATGLPSLGSGTVTATTVGLGGVAATSDGTVSTSPYPAKDSLKLNALPKEIMTTVDSFKEFVKKQKALGSDLMRISFKPLQKVTSESAEVASEVTGISIEVTGARAAARRLRENANKTLQAAERTGGANDSDCPPQLLRQVIIDLESQFVSLRQQLQTAERHLQTQPKLLTQEELNQGICRIYESLVALAGRLQIVHAQVHVLKERQLEMRKKILNDNTDIFQVKKDSNNMEKLLSNQSNSRSGLCGLESKAEFDNSNQISGPTPFTSVANAFTALKPLDNNPWGQGQKTTL